MQIFSEGSLPLSYTADDIKRQYSEGQLDPDTAYKYLQGLGDSPDNAQQELEAWGLDTTVETQSTAPNPQNALGEENNLEGATPPDQIPGAPLMDQLGNLEYPEELNTIDHNLEDPSVDTSTTDLLEENNFDSLSPMSNGYIPSVKIPHADYSLGKVADVFNYTPSEEQKSFSEEDKVAFDRAMQKFREEGGKLPGEELERKIASEDPKDNLNTPKKAPYKAFRAPNRKKLGAYQEKVKAENKDIPEIPEEDQTHKINYAGATELDTMHKKAKYYNSLYKIYLTWLEEHPEPSSVKDGNLSEFVADDQAESSVDEAGLEDIDTLYKNEKEKYEQHKKEDEGRKRGVPKANLGGPSSITAPEAGEDLDDVDKITTQLISKTDDNYYTVYSAVAYLMGIGFKAEPFVLDNDIEPDKKSGKYADHNDLQRSFKNDLAARAITLLEKFYGVKDDIRVIKRDSKGRMILPGIIQLLTKNGELNWDAVDKFNTAIGAGKHGPADSNSDRIAFKNMLRRYVPTTFKEDVGTRGGRKVDKKESATVFEREVFPMLKRSMVKEKYPKVENLLAALSTTATGKKLSVEDKIDYFVTGVKGFKDQEDHFNDSNENNIKNDVEKQQSKYSELYQSVQAILKASTICEEIIKRASSLPEDQRLSVYTRDLEMIQASSLDDKIKVLFPQIFEDMLVALNKDQSEDVFFYSELQKLVTKEAVKAFYEDPQDLIDDFMEVTGNQYSVDKDSLLEALYLKDTYAHKMSNYYWDDLSGKNPDTMKPARATKEMSGIIENPDFDSTKEISKENPKYVKGTLNPGDVIRDKNGGIVWTNKLASDGSQYDNPEADFKVKQIDVINTDLGEQLYKILKNNFGVYKNYTKEIDDDQSHKTEIRIPLSGSQLAPTFELSKEQKKRLTQEEKEELIENNSLYLRITIGINPNTVPVNKESEQWYKHLAGWINEEGRNKYFKDRYGDTRDLVGERNDLGKIYDPNSSPKRDLEKSSPLKKDSAGTKKQKGISEDLLDNVFNSIHSVYKNQEYAGENRISDNSKFSKNKSYYQFAIERGRSPNMLNDFVIFGGGGQYFDSYDMFSSDRSLQQEAINEFISWVLEFLEAYTKSRSFAGELPEQENLKPTHTNSFSSDWDEAMETSFNENDFVEAKAVDDARIQKMIEGIKYKYGLTEEMIANPPSWITDDGPDYSTSHNYNKDEYRQAIKAVRRLRKEGLPKYTPNPEEHRAWQLRKHDQDLARVNDSNRPLEKLPKNQGKFIDYYMPLIVEDYEKYIDPKQKSFKFADLSPITKMVIKLVYDHFEISFSERSNTDFLKLLGKYRDLLVDGKAPEKVKKPKSGSLKKEGTVTDKSTINEDLLEGVV
jgi:hypothetical protein